MRNLLLITGLLLFFLAEVLRIYFVLPYTVNQEIHATQIAYFSYENIVWIRIVALLLVAYPALNIFRNGKIWKKIALFTCVMISIIAAYYSNIYLNASHKYQPLAIKNFTLKRDNKISTDKQIIGVSLNGETKAYPLQLVGYHHFITDTIGNKPVLITYCTICRSARVYSLLVNGKPDKFELVGLNRFNAVLKDSATKSWWQQATGVAIAGPMKGKSLNELSFQQASLSSWLRKYPGSKILQPDPRYAQQYALLESYDKTAFKNGIIETDSATYSAKSLIIGFVNKSRGHSYDWNKINYVKMFEDTLPGTPFLITVEGDNTSFHVWKRDVKDHVLEFEKTKNANEITDINTSSIWNMDGHCIEGELKGTQLEEIQSYQETRESWNSFHPNTDESDIPAH